MILSLKPASNFSKVLFSRWKWRKFDFKSVAVSRGQNITRLANVTSIDLITKPTWRQSGRNLGEFGQRFLVAEVPNKRWFAYSFWWNGGKVLSIPRIQHFGTRESRWLCWRRCKVEALRLLEIFMFAMFLTWRYSYERTLFNKDLSR